MMTTHDAVIPSIAPPVVLITGAARRIGAAIAQTLHAAGMQVLLHYRDSKAAAAALAADLNRQRPDSARILQADLLSDASRQRLAAQAIDAYGGLDYLVNNASTFYPTPLGQITAAGWDDLFGTNLRVPLFLTQDCLMALQERQGAVVNIIDIHAMRPLPGYAVYSCAKAGLWTLTRALARELGPAVRVNGVAPGAILSPEAEENMASHAVMVQQTPLQRQGQPEDIAKTVLFLLRDAPYITGQVLPVDGGRSVV